MFKRFSCFLVVGLLTFILSSTGCDTNKSDNSAAMLLLLLNSPTGGVVNITDGVSFQWTSSGFANPGGGTYIQCANPASGTGQFWIEVPAGTGTYNQNTSNLISYTDTSGTLWTNVAAQTFSLTVSAWSGGTATGNFSGTLKDFSSPATNYVSGSFVVKILN